METWEMTKLEFLKSHYRIEGRPVPCFFSSRAEAQELHPGKRITKASLATMRPFMDIVIRYEHRPAVIAAWNACKPVPAEVLKDYPELRGEQFAMKSGRAG